MSELTMSDVLQERIDITRELKRSYEKRLQELKKDGQLESDEAKIITNDIERLENDIQATEKAVVVHSPIRSRMRNMLLEDTVSWQDYDQDMIEAENLKSLGLLTISSRNWFGTVYYTGTKTELGCDVANSKYIQDISEWNELQDNFSTKIDLFNYIIEQVKKEK